MAGQMERVLRESIAASDRKDFKVFLTFLTADAQLVDEISRRWVRGRPAIAEYFKNVGPQINDLHSEFSNVSEKATGDAGILTCWMEQDYTMKRKRTHISCPVTVAFRRLRGNWRISLIHAVPLPEAAS
jgi:ketosteroid isomerase-like protein